MHFIKCMGKEKKLKKNLLGKSRWDRFTNVKKKKKTWPMILHSHGPFTLSRSKDRK